MMTQPHRSPLLLHLSTPPTAPSLYLSFVAEDEKRNLAMELDKKFCRHEVTPPSPSLRRKCGTESTPSPMKPNPVTPVVLMLRVLYVGTSQMLPTQDYCHWICKISFSLPHISRCRNRVFFFWLKEKSP